MSDSEFGAFSMIELFQMEEQQQSALMTDGLIDLEQDPTSQKLLESLMRASHSIKGAARMVGVDPVVDIAHIMEDCFVAAQNGELILEPNSIDVLLKSVDLISQIAHSADDIEAWANVNKAQLENNLSALGSVDSSKSTPTQSNNTIDPVNLDDGLEDEFPAKNVEKNENENENDVNEIKVKQNTVEQSNLKIDSVQIDHLMRLAGEASDGSRWIRKYSESLLHLKRKHFELISALDHLSEKFREDPRDIQIQEMIYDVQAKASDYRIILSDRMNSLDGFERRNISVSKRLSQAVIKSRMQPFGDGTGGFPRLVRDIARKLEKDVRIEIEGKGTLVDREILAKIESPLNHLLRNAIDHGIESPGIREALGKPKKGTIRLTAYHMYGMLFITIIDDGQGVDIEGLREKIYKKGLVADDIPNMLSDEELLEFLFLPSFSTRDTVTEISGRGVGLDVVHDTVQEMGGVIRTFSTYGEGTTFQLQLPLTLSVIPSLLVKMEGEAYAFPLARIDSIHSIESSDLQVVDGRQFIDVDGQNIGLISASQVLNLNNANKIKGTISIIVIHERSVCYGLVVDECFGEQDLVVQPLPKKIGKIKDISTAAILENGLPILIVDIDDMLRSIEKLVSSGLVDNVDKQKQYHSLSNKKRILVVDDSITVREVERNMLEAVGYDVDVAVDGMDGWHMMHQLDFDLVITDIDMPRMDGIEFIHEIKSKESYKDIPIIVVSYKDREADRKRAFGAGADRYLTKGSFQDNSLRDAVEGLIGEAVE